MWGVLRKASGSPVVCQCCRMPDELSVRQGRCSAELIAGVPCAVCLPGRGIAWLAEQICEWAVALGLGVPLVSSIPVPAMVLWVAPFRVRSDASVCRRLGRLPV